MNLFQTSLLIINFIGGMIILITVINIRNRNNQVIKLMDTKYQFDIINGPTLEYLFENFRRYDEYGEGFELLPYHEPFRHSGFRNPVPERRTISYFIVPTMIHEFIRYDNGNTLYPGSEYEPTKNDVVEFLNEKVRILKIRATIPKEPRGSVNAYFGGGTIYEYGKDLKLNIIYNPDTRKGTMIIEEK
jgi:hypothetical protein